MDMTHNSFNKMGPTQIRIVKLLMVPTRRHYMDVFKRPFELNATHENVRRLGNMLDQYIGSYGKVNETGIANMTPDMFRISHMAGGKAEIVNGWGTQRLRFILITSSPAADGHNEELSCFQGYTEYYDPTLSGDIDYNMKFHINTITNMLKMIDPHTKQYRVYVRGTHNLLLNNINPYDQGVNYHTDKLIRPQDIISNLALRESVGPMTNSAGFVNTSDNLDNIVKVSSRANSNPLRHFAKTINAYTTGRATVTQQFGNTEDTLNSALNTVTETNPLHNDLIERLRTMTGVLVPTTFSINELLMIDPNTENNSLLITQDQLVYNQNHFTGTNVLDTDNTSATFGANQEAVIAASIQSSISGLMVENMLSKLTFKSTNMVSGGGVITTPIDAGSFIDGLDPQPLVAKTLAAFDSTIMPEVTHGNMIPIEVTVSADILGDTTIAILVGGSSPEVYRYPTFADSLFTPVITNQNTSNMIINDMHEVFDMVSIHNAQNETLHY